MLDILITTVYLGDIALLIAAMSAHGTSRIANIAPIDRGYEDIEHRLNAVSYTHLDVYKRQLQNGNDENV